MPISSEHASSAAPVSPIAGYQAVPDDLALLIAQEERRLRQQLGPDRARRVLLIGGAGYIGGPLTMELLRNGYSVRNLDLFIYGHEGASPAFLTHNNYEFHYGDFASPKALDRALQDVSDVIILGGLVGDPITKAYPNESHSINTLAIQACIDRLNGRGLNKVIFVSTCSNYGLIENDVLADEEFELNPLSSYAKSKIAAEQHLLSLEGQTDYHPVILRFATAFGVSPRMRFDLTVNEFTRDLFVKRELVVFDAHTWRPYCHVRDFARLMTWVLRLPAEKVAFQIFNAGGEANNHTKQSIVDIISERVPGCKISYQSNSGDPRNYRVDFSKLRGKLHFQPQYSVVDGVNELLSVLQNNFFRDVEQRRNYYGNYEISYTS
jgi:nucleoside-diphosphate-sugar epimerase